MCGVNVMDEVFRTGFGEAYNQMLMHDEDNSINFCHLIL